MDSIQNPTSVFFAAYLDHGANIAAAARQLGISTEKALDFLSDPAVKAKIESWDESQERAARTLACEGIKGAMSHLARLSQVLNYEIAQKAASNLSRASLWLARVADGSLPAERTARRAKQRAARRAQEARAAESLSVTAPMSPSAPAVWIPSPQSGGSPASATAPVCDAPVCATGGLPASAAVPRSPSPTTPATARDFPTIPHRGHARNSPAHALLARAGSPDSS